MKKWALILGYAVGLVVFISHLREGLNQAPANTVWETYRRVDWWILSARCTQLRRVLLVACGPNSQLIPIEDVSPTDDRGHGLIANLVALFQERPFEKVDMVRINVWINAFGVGFLAAVFILCGLPWIGALCLMAGAVYGIPGPIANADAQSTFFGEFCLILMPVPFLIQRAHPIVSKWRLATAEGLSAIALIAAILLREAIGLVGVSSAFLLLAISVWEKKPKSVKQARGAIVFLALMLLALGSNSIMLTLRNRWLSLPPAHLISSHGIAHAFHQGLGTEENPWGIRYDDRNGAETVSKIDPQIVYGTPAYYREIGRLYRDIVIHHPLQVSEIYLKKLKKTLTLPLFYGGFSIFWYALVVTLLWPWLWKKIPTPSIPLRVTAGMELVLIVFLLQGVFIRPVAWFLYPAKFGVLLLLSGLVETGMSVLSSGFSLPHRCSSHKARLNP